MAAKKLRHLREQIDKTDRRILELICRRADLAQQIGNQKQKEKSSIYRPDREREVYRNLKFFLEGHPKTKLSVKSLERIYCEIMSASIALEGGPVTAYLGPQASFSHTALMDCFGSQAQSIPQESIPDIFRVVQAGKEARYGLVPVDNSIEGSIGITLDSLINFDLHIYAEHYISVFHCLLCHKKIKPNAVRRLYTFGIAQEQCREWVHSNLNTKDIEFINMPSTAAAAKAAAEKKDGAAIASKLAAQTYGLEIIAKNIQDNPNNITRFLVIGKEQCPPTKDDKTSIVFTLADQAGSLSQTLSFFAKEKINLTKIESRSRRRGFGEYNFFVDFIGHSEEKHIRCILKNVQKNSSFLRIFGSYPRISLPA